MSKNILLTFLACMSVTVVAETDIDKHIQVFSDAKANMHTDMTIDLNKKYQLSEQDKTKLEEIELHINSDEWHDKIDEIKGQIYLDTTDAKSRWKSLEQLQDDADDVVPFSDKPILFISSSIPEHVLRRYAQDLEPKHGVMVLRGVVGGLKHFKYTAEFIGNFLKKSPHCQDSTSGMCDRYNVGVIIDPILFREYRITQVPAFTIHGKENFSAYCKKDKPLNKADFVSYGDHSIKYHITQFNEHKKNKNEK